MNQLEFLKQDSEDVEDMDNADQQIEEEEELQEEPILVPGRLRPSFQRLAYNILKINKEMREFGTEAFILGWLILRMIVGGLWGMCGGFWLVVVIMVLLAGAYGILQFTGFIIKVLQTAFAL